MASLAGYTTGILINSPMPKTPVFFIRFNRNIFIGVEFGSMQILRAKELTFCNSVHFHPLSRQWVLQVTHFTCGGNSITLHYS